LSFHLTAKAKADLKGIGHYTLKKWGREQRNRYLKKNDDAFQELSQDPGKGRNCDEIREVYQQYGIGKHFIFYRTTGPRHIEITPPYPAWQNEPRKTSDRKLNRPTLDHTCYRMQLGSLLNFILFTKPSRFLDMLSQTMALSCCPENLKRTPSCNTMGHIPPMQQYAAVGNIFSLSSKLLLYFLASITKM